MSYADALANKVVNVKDCVDEPSVRLHDNVVAGFFRRLLYQGVDGRSKKPSDPR